MQWLNKRKQQIDQQLTTPKKGNKNKRKKSLSWYMTSSIIVIWWFRYMFNCIVMTNDKHWNANHFCRIHLTNLPILLYGMQCAVCSTDYYVPAPCTNTKWKMISIVSWCWFYLYIQVLAYIMYSEWSFNSIEVTIYIALFSLKWYYISATYISFVRLAFKLKRNNNPYTIIYDVQCML